MKKSFVKSVSLLLATFLLTACGAKAPTEKPVVDKPTEDIVQEVGDKEPITITAIIQQSRNFEGLQKMIDKLAKEENIIIDAQIVPDAEALSLIKMKLNSGESPDIIDYNIPAIYDIIDPESNFADLSNEAWVGKLLISENVKHDDGKVYGFPFLSVPGMHGFTYNKDVFEKLNLKVPTTWEQLLEVCETIKTKGNGVVPIFMPKDSWVPQILMTDNYMKAIGAKKVEEFASKVMNNETKWTDVPEFAEVLDKYLDLYKKGYINNNFISAVYDDAIAAVADGSAAMHFNGDFFAASVMDTNPDANIGIFAMSMTPGVDYLTANISSAGFVAYNNSKNLDTVKKIFDLWSTPEYGSLYFEGRPGFPAFPGIDGGEVPAYLKEINEQFIQKGKATSEFNAYVMELNPLFETSLYIYYLEAPAKGEMDGKAILEKFQGEFEQYMKDKGTEGF